MTKEKNLHAVSLGKSEGKKRREGKSEEERKAHASEMGKKSAEARKKKIA